MVNAVILKVQRLSSSLSGNHLRILFICIHSTTYTITYTSQSIQWLSTSKTSYLLSEVQELQRLYIALSYLLASMVRSGNNTLFPLQLNDILDPERGTIVKSCQVADGNDDASSRIEKKPPMVDSSQPPSSSRLNARLIADATIGLSDGLTVPFALTSGLSTLGSTKVVIFGGLAELIAGSISMGLGGYLGAKGEASVASSSKKSNFLPYSVTNMHLGQ